MNIRPYQDRDAPQVLDLMTKNYHRVYTEEWWNWKYKEDYFGESIIRVAEDNEKIVGTRSLWAWKLRFKGNVYNAYQPADTLVDEAYRGRGLFTQMTLSAINEARQNEAVMLFNFPNNNSLPKYLRLGWELLDEIHWYIKITNLLKLFTLNKDRSERITVQNMEDIIFPNIMSEPPERYWFSTIWTNEYLRWRFTNRIRHRYRIDSSERDPLVYSINIYKGIKELLILNADVDQNILDRAISIATHSAAYIAIPAVTGSEKEELLKKNAFLRINKCIHFVVLSLNDGMKTQILKIGNWNIGLENIDTF
jgi:GNAT superfamily N-acetyltransferase